jgi:hypothetical protein
MLLSVFQRKGLELWETARGLQSCDRVATHEQVILSALAFTFLNLIQLTNHKSASLCGVVVQYADYQKQED